MAIELAKVSSLREAFHSITAQRQFPHFEAYKHERLYITLKLKVRAILGFPFHLKFRET